MTRPKVWINETATTTATQTDLIEEVVSGAQNIVKYGHEDQWCPDENHNKLDDVYTGRNFFK